LWGVCRGFVRDVGGFLGMCRDCVWGVEGVFSPLVVGV